jgi:hypothetical protein
MSDTSIENLLAQGSVAAIGGELRARRLSVADMAAWYLARMAAFDRAGPALNAVRTQNPHAIRRGPVHVAGQ